MISWYCFLRSFAYGLQIAYHEEDARRKKVNSAARVELNTQRMPPDV
jgi:hypothetical protein